MDANNHFSKNFKHKSIPELKNIIEKEGFTSSARLAAILELEERGENIEAYMRVKNTILAKQQRRAASLMSGLRYKTFGRRFFAAILDGLAMIPISLITSYITQTDVLPILIVANLLNALFPYIYSVLMHGGYGQTLGKIAMDIKVIDVDEEEEITMKQAFLRDAVPVSLILFMYIISYSFPVENVDPHSFDYRVFIPSIILSFTSLTWTITEILSMLFNEKSRAVHDFIAKTVVVRTN